MPLGIGMDCLVCASKPLHRCHALAGPYLNVARDGAKRQDSIVHTYRVRNQKLVVIGQGLAALLRIGLERSSSRVQRP